MSQKAADPGKVAQNEFVKRDRVAQGTLHSNTSSASPSGSVLTVKDLVQTLERTSLKKKAPVIEEPNQIQKLAKHFDSIAKKDDKTKKGTPRKNIPKTNNVNSTRLNTPVPLQLGSGKEMTTTVGRQLLSAEDRRKFNSKQRKYHNNKKVPRPKSRPRVGLGVGVPSNNNNSPGGNNTLDANLIGSAKKNSEGKPRPKVSRRLDVGVPDEHLTSAVESNPITTERAVNNNVNIPEGATGMINNNSPGDVQVINITEDNTLTNDNMEGMALPIEEEIIKENSKLLNPAINNNVKNFVARMKPNINPKQRRSKNRFIPNANNPTDAEVRQEVTELKDNVESENVSNKPENKPDMTNNITSQKYPLTKNTTNGSVEEVDIQKLNDQGVVQSQSSDEQEDSATKRPDSFENDFPLNVSLNSNGNHNVPPPMGMSSRILNGISRTLGRTSGRQKAPTTGAKNDILEENDDNNLEFGQPKGTVRTVATPSDLVSTVNINAQGSSRIINSQAPVTAQNLNGPNPNQNPPANPSFSFKRNPHLHIKSQISQQRSMSQYSSLSGFINAPNPGSFGHLPDLDFGSVISDAPRQHAGAPLNNLNLAPYTVTNRAGGLRFSKARTERSDLSGHTYRTTRTALTASAATVLSGAQAIGSILDPLSSAYSPTARETFEDVQESCLDLCCRRRNYLSQDQIIAAQVKRVKSFEDFKKIYDQTPQEAINDITRYSPLLEYESPQICPKNYNSIVLLEAASKVGAEIRYSTIWIEVMKKLQTRLKSQIFLIMSGREPQMSKLNALEAGIVAMEDIHRVQGQIRAKYLHPFRQYILQFFKGVNQSRQNNNGVNPTLPTPNATTTMSRNAPLVFVDPTERTTYLIVKKLHQRLQTIINREVYLRKQEVGLILVEGMGWECGLCHKGKKPDSKYQRRLFVCDHVFHKECIENWFQQDHYICPICSKDVDAIENKSCNQIYLFFFEFLYYVLFIFPLIGAFFGSTISGFAIWLNRNIERRDLNFVPAIDLEDRGFFKCVLTSYMAGFIFFGALSQGCSCYRYYGTPEYENDVWLILPCLLGLVWSPFLAFILSDLFSDGTIFEASATLRETWKGFAVFIGFYVAFIAITHCLTRFVRPYLVWCMVNFQDSMSEATFGERLYAIYWWCLCSPIYFCCFGDDTFDQDVDAEQQETSQQGDNWNQILNSMSVSSEGRPNSERIQGINLQSSYRPMDADEEEEFDIENFRSQGGIDDFYGENASQSLRTEVIGTQGHV